MATTVALLGIIDALQTQTEFLGMYEVSKCFKSAADVARRCQDYSIHYDDSNWCINLSLLIILFLSGHGCRFQSFKLLRNIHMPPALTLPSLLWFLRLIMSDWPLQSLSRGHSTHIYPEYDMIHSFGSWNIIMAVQQSTSSPNRSLVLFSYGNSRICSGHRLKPS